MGFFLLNFQLFVHKICYVCSFFKIKSVGNLYIHLFFFSFLGLIEYINTEVSASKSKKFPLVTFVDTPGLVDGDMIYPFDVNKAMLWLGDLVDLIFVFFDPIGQVGFAYFLRGKSDDQPSLIFAGLV